MNNRRIFDMHAHIFPEKIVVKAVQSICDFYDIPMNCSGTTEELLKLSAKSGVERILVHSTATKPEQVSSINNYIIGETVRHKEFIGFGTLHPEFNDIYGEVERIKEAGLQGVKLHPDFQRFNMDDQCADDIYKACSGKLPILFHVGDHRQDFSNPARLTKVLKKYPDLKVIAAHFGGWSVWNDSYNLLEPSDNLYFDTSSSLYTLDKDTVRAFLDKFGSDKFLFGTDYPMWTVMDEIDRVMALGLSEDELDQVFFKNAEKFLGLDIKYS